MKTAYKIGIGFGAVLIAGAAWWHFHAAGRSSGSAAGAQGSASAASAPTTALVKTQPPERRSLTETLSAVGDIAPGQIVGVSFPRAGQLTRLVVLPGNRVPKGGLLATLSPDPATQVAYQQAVSAMNLARREADRQRELLSLRLATQSQADSAEKAYQDAVTSVNALKAVGGGTGESEVRALFDGVVLSLAAAQGDRIAANAPVLQFGQVGALRVQLGLEPAQSHRVHAGTAVTMKPVANTTAVSTIQSRVSEIQDVVDPKTQLVSAVVMLPPGPSGVLVPGMKMRATLEIGKVDAIAVPSSAVLTDERGAYVYQAVQGKARRVEVKPGIESGGWIALNGLADTSTPVVTLGNYELADGMPITTKAPAPAASAASSGKAAP